MRLRVLPVSLGFTLVLAGAAWAQIDKPTIKDRFDQVLATFLGDPAANVDIDMKHVLDTWRGMNPKPLEDLTPEEARRQPSPVEAATKLLAEHGTSLEPAGIATKDLEVDGAEGRLKARLFAPTAPNSDGKRRPLIVFYHGGGFVLANDAGSTASARALAATTGAMVLAADYRLAPEHKFPAAPDDALAVYKWALANLDTLGADPKRVALAGEGAGGMLAVDTAVAARDARLPGAAALALITPAAGIDLKTNSWIEDSTARPWNKAAVEWALRQYLPTPQSINDPRIDLVGKADLDGLPPTIIVTAEDDPLRSDGERLGGKLRRATVPVEMRDYPGVTHDFFGMGAAVKKAATAERFVGEVLTRYFNPPPQEAMALQRMGVAPYPEAPDPK